MVRQIQESDRPLFVLVASMQNHGPYSVEDFVRFECRLSSPGGGKAPGDLLSYCESPRRSDQALETLVNGLKATADPVWLVFLGDHLPVLEATADGSPYVQSEKHLGLESLRRKYSTPAFLWTNTDASLADVPDEVCAPVLMSHVLRAMRISHPFYTGFLAQLERVSAACSPHVSLLPNGQLIRGMPETAEFRDYQTLTYDIFFGRRELGHTFFPEWDRGTAHRYEDGGQSAVRVLENSPK